MTGNVAVYDAAQLVNGPDQTVGPIPLLQYVYQYVRTAILLSENTARNHVSSDIRGAVQATSRFSHQRLGEIGQRTI